MNKKRAVVLVCVLYFLTVLMPMPIAYAKDASVKSFTRLLDSQATGEPMEITTGGQIEIEGESTTSAQLEVDQSRVQELIKSAESLWEGTVVGTTPGCYSIADRDEFRLHIDKAKEGLDKAQSQEEVDQVGEALQKAIERFKACVILKVGDINADGKVDVVDLGLISYYFRRGTIGDDCCQQCRNADINKDGIIDTRDLTLVAINILEE